MAFHFLKRTQTSRTEPHETARGESRNPSTCFVTVTARTMARPGDPKLQVCVNAMGTGNASPTIRVNSVAPSTDESRAKNRGPPLFFGKTDPCGSAQGCEATGCDHGRASADHSIFCLRALALLLWMLPLFAALRMGFCALPSPLLAWPSDLAFGAPCPRPIPSCIYAASNEAASLCHEVTAEPSDGDQCTSG